jgi:hypothetical protein
MSPKPVCGRRRDDSAVATVNGDFSPTTILAISAALLQGSLSYTASKSAGYMLLSGASALHDQSGNCVHQLKSFSRAIKTEAFPFRSTAQDGIWRCTALSVHSRVAIRGNGGTQLGLSNPGNKYRAPR